MALSFVLSNAGRDLCGDALLADLVSGTIVIQQIGVVNNIITFNIAAAGNTSVNGLITLAVAAMTGAAGFAGVADTALFKNPGATTIATANVGIGAGFSVNLDNNNIAAGQVVTITSATITVPAGT